MRGDRKSANDEEYGTADASRCPSDPLPAVRLWQPTATRRAHMLPHCRPAWPPKAANPLTVKGSAAEPSLNIRVPTIADAQVICFFEGPRVFWSG